MLNVACIEMYLCSTLLVGTEIHLANTKHLSCGSYAKSLPGIMRKRLCLSVVGASNSNFVSTQVSIASLITIAHFIKPQFN